MQDKDNSNEMRFPGQPEDLLRFKINLLSLAEKHYDILHDEQWIEILTQYQLQLYRAGYTEFSHNLLQIFNDTCVCSTAEYREKSLFVLTFFLANIRDDVDDEMLQALSWIFLRWLYLEQELLACSEYVFSQLPVIPEKLLLRGKFAQFIVWLELVQKISSGELERPQAVKALVSRLKNNLLSVFLDKKIELNVSSEVKPDSETACLVSYFAAGGASMLIRELYHSHDKNRRLALVEVLKQLGGNVAGKLIENLGEDASWYMVRNALQVISHFDSGKHVGLVLPFLKYPDLRVQQQVIDFICRLEDEEKVEQLIFALETCHDRLKSTVVEILSSFRSHDIERAYTRLLASRAKIEQWSRDQLLLSLCKALKAYPTKRVTEALQQLITEREQEKRLGDPVVSAARKTIQNLSDI